MPKIKKYTIGYWFENNDCADYDAIDVTAEYDYLAMTEAKKIAPEGKNFKILDIIELHYIRINGDKLFAGDTINVDWSSLTFKVIDVQDLGADSLVTIEDNLLINSQTITKINKAKWRN